MSEQELLHYRLLAKLGEGGMGAVWQARDTRLEREVAIKVLPAAYSADPVWRERFLREARAAAALNHPGICTVHAIEEAGDQLFLVMEFLSGHTLRQLVAGATLPYEMVLRYVAEAATAIAVAHDRGVIHRDIKSSNLMRLADGRIKVLDFGLAQMRGASGMTREGMVMGTPSYMSPEQARGEGTDHRSDLWSLGVVLYELLTGIVPFQGENEQAILYAVMTRPPRPLAQVRPDLPPWIGSLIDKALQKDPQWRFQSAAEFAAALSHPPGPEVTLTFSHPPEPVPEPTGMMAVPSGSQRLAASLAERRLITFLHIELTLQRPAADPEEFEESLREAWSFCETLVRRFEGILQRRFGASALAIFGYPTAREDATRLAADAGLAIVERFRGSSLRFAVKAGIEAGLTIAEPDAIPMSGEAEHLAATLAHNAPGNALLAGPLSAKLLQPYFHLESAGDTFRVLHRSTARSRLEAIPPSALTPLTGRQQELGLLLTRWERAREGNGQVVTIAGSPGLGKSRLAYELKARAAADPSAALVECFCAPQYRSTALHPVLDFLDRMVLDAERQPAAAERLLKLEGLLVEYGFDLRGTIPLLAPLFSIPLPPSYPPLELTPDRQRHLALETLLGFLTERAARQPVLFLVEDLHWADPSTLDLLQMVVAQAPSCSLLAVFTHRPEFVPPFGSRGHLAQVSLDRLSRPDALRLAESATRGSALDPGTLQQILDNSDGVPLYLEEIAHMVAEAGAASGRIAVPATLRDSFMARLDPLGPAKPLVKIAAVLGREFPLALLEAMAEAGPGELDPQMRRLTDAEILYPRGTAGRRSYVFKHALLQEAAYDSLLRKNRLELHAEVATLLRERFPETAQRQPEVVAHHLALGGRPLEAVPFLQQAGMSALTRSAYPEAIAHLTRAVELLRPVAGRPPEIELQTMTLLGTALLASKGFGAAEVGETYRRAEELLPLAPPGTPLLLPTLWGLWVFHLVRGHLDAARATASRMLDTGVERGDPAMVLEGAWTLGNACFWRGELEPSRVHLERALELYDPARHGSHALLFGQDPHVAALCYLSFNQWFRGRFGEALATADRAIEAARAMRHPFSIGWALTFRAVLDCFARNVDGAYERALAGIQYCTEQAYPFWLTCTLVVKGWAECRRGAVDTGLAGIEQGLAIMQAIGSEVIQPLFEGIHAETLLHAGRIDQALDQVETALARARRLPVGVLIPDLHRIRGEIRRVQGDAAAAEAEFRTALGEAQAQGNQFYALRAALALKDGSVARQFAADDFSSADLEQLRRL